MNNSDGNSWTIQRERNPTERRTEPGKPASVPRHREDSRARGPGHQVGRDDGRGRSADKPSDIPAQGWKDILLRVFRGIAEDRILANAAAVAFYSLLAIFPALTALVSIYGLFSDPTTIEQQLEIVSGVLPGGALDIIRDQLHRLVAQPRGTLSVSFVIALLVSLWSANSAIKAMFDALNTVYEEREERSFVKLNAITLTFTIALIGFLILALVAFVAVPVLLNYLPGFIGTVINIARWPLMAVLVAVVLAFVYRYGPSREEPKWRWLTWGSAFAAIGWLAFSAAFSFYAANFGTFNKTYGSLGAVVGFMTWMWLSVVVILIGGKLNAEMEHQTARDTTEGAPKPLGARRAKMADSVGQAQS